MLTGLGFSYQVEIRILRESSLAVGVGRVLLNDDLLGGAGRTHEFGDDEVACLPFKWVQPGSREAVVPTTAIASSQW